MNKLPIWLRFFLRVATDLVKLLFTVAVLFGVMFGSIWGIVNSEILETIVSYVAGTLAVVVLFVGGLVYLFCVYDDVAHGIKRKP